MAIPDRLRQRAAREKCFPAAIIGYGVSLDTRTTSAGNRPLTATRRVHNVEGWRCYERGHEPDFAVLVGRNPGAATGGRCQRHLSSRLPVAARLAVRSGLGRRLAFHRISPARVDRACIVPGIAPVHRTCCQHMGRAASGSSPHRCARGDLRAGLPRTGAPPRLRSVHVCPSAAGYCAGPGRTAGTRDRPPTSPTVRVDATTSSTSGGVTTWRPGAGHRC